MVIVSVPEEFATVINPPEREADTVTGDEGVREISVHVLFSTEVPYVAFEVVKSWPVF